MANPTIYGNGTTTASNGANTIVHYYNRAGIKAANSRSIYSQFCDRQSMTTNMGKTYKVSKWQHIYDLDQTNVNFSAKGYLGKRDLATITTNLANTGMSGAITEGAGAINKVTPKKITVETSIARYGFMIEYTDEVTIFSEDTVHVKYREELGYLINQASEDLIQKDMLNGCGIVINAAGVAKNQLGATIAPDGTNEDLYKVSFDLIRRAVKALVRNRAQRNSEIVTGSTKIGTAPINSAFYAIIGPEVKYDLETLTRSGGIAHEDWAYIPAYQYASATNLAEGEVGSMHDVRFIESEGAMMEAGAGAAVPAGYTGTLSNNGTNFDVFPILFPTKGAFATLGLKGIGKVVFHAKAPNEVELGNPYGTKGFFSANMFYAGIALQPEKLARVNVLATA